MDLIALPLQGGSFLLYVTQGDGATRLCPGLLCYGLSARLNARLRRASYLQNVQTVGARFIAPIYRAQRNAEFVVFEVTIRQE